MIGGKNCVLIILSRAEPFEGAIISSLRYDGFTPIVYNITDQRITIDGSEIHHHPFFQADSSPEYFRKKEFEEIFERFNIEVTISIGLDASLFFMPLRARGILNEVILADDDVSFPKRRKPMMEKIDRLRGRLGRVFFNNQSNFSHANDKELEVQNFLIDIDPGIPRYNNDIISSKEPNICLITPDFVDHDVLGFYVQGIEERLPESFVKVVNDRDLFTNRDIHLSESLHARIKLYLQQFSHVVFIGFSRNTVPLLRCFSTMFDKVSVQDNLRLHNFPWDMEKELDLFTGPLLIDDVVNKVRGSAPVAVAPETGRPASVVDQMNAVNKTDFPPFYEELLCVKQDGPLDVFFSVRPIEMSSAGAHIQRIRHFFYAFHKVSRNAIEVSSPPLAFNRRVKMIRYLIGQGRDFGVFYGENSTGPMESYGSILALAELLKDLRGCGCGIGWFIRDLHFLYDEVWGNTDASAIKVRANFEFLAISEYADVFYAPTDPCCDDFRRLLPDQKHPETRWIELPPGARDICHPARVLQAGRKVAFVYSGGLAPLYAFPMYLEAVRKFSRVEGVGFDFVVRESEKHYLIDAGLGDCEGDIRIITMDFDTYTSNAEHTVGIALLENEYAKNAFPFKVMSYLSRCMPVACFKDQYISDFVEKYRVGSACFRSQPHVNAAIEDFIQDAKRGEWPYEIADFENVCKENTWENRCLQVVGDLEFAGK